MYRVTVETAGQEYVLHDIHSQDEQIYDDELSEEMGKTATFKFTIAPNHPHIDKIVPLSSEIRIYKDGRPDLLGPGRHAVCGYLQHPDSGVRGRPVLSGRQPPGSLYTIRDRNHLFAADPCSAQQPGGGQQAITTREYYRIHPGHGEDPGGLHGHAERAHHSASRQLRRISAGAGGTAGYGIWII